MHTLTLNYRDSMSYTAQDAHTHAHCTELLLRGIHTAQPAHNIIELEDASMTTFALLYLSGYPELFTVSIH